MDIPTDQMKTHDFMNVESFSQLPFIRPTQAVKEKGIRVFGIEFGTRGETREQSEFTENNNNLNNNNEENKGTEARENDDNNGNNNSNSNRRFECHYCCRNFPTSQALGGHQNAHKRERQHAKRTHLQSAAASLVHHHGAGPFLDGHIYGSGGGLMSYGRLGPASPSSSTVGSTYASWTNSRVYGNYHGVGAYPHQMTTPISGSPLRLCRVPPYASSLQSNYTPTNFSPERSYINYQLPLFADNGDHEMKPSHVGGGERVQDHVSLDLHL